MHDGTEQQFHEHRDDLSRTTLVLLRTQQVLCFEEKKVDSPAKLYVMEVGRDKDAPGGVFRLSPQQIPNAADAPNDFPVAMQVIHRVLLSQNELTYCEIA